MSELIRVLAEALRGFVPEDRLFDAADAAATALRRHGTMTSMPPGSHLASDDITGMVSHEDKPL